MTLAQLVQVARAIIPNCKVDVVSDALLYLLLNDGVKDITVYTKCLPSNKKFNVTASQSEYVLSTVISDFLCPDKPGLYFNRGTTTVTNYFKLNPETLASLDSKYPLWRDRSDDEPMSYSIDGNILTVTPPPNASLTSGFWLYYIKKPVDMTQTTHYPFSGSTVEFSHLSIFDMAIIKYASWMINPMIGQETDASIAMQEYFKIREEKNSLYKRRPDISNVAQWQGKIC